jgi:DNA repair protein RecO (recombination protein O)
MIEWLDEGIVLSTQPHGEDAAIVHMLTREHGKHAGLARGAQGKRNRATYQPGTTVQARWRGRLAEHLGQYTCEPLHSPFANLLEMPDRLTALASAMAVADRALPEREVHTPIYDGTQALIEALHHDAWAEAYVQWEVQVLRELGFGLDLRRCAGGGSGRLVYVSPRSGRAVSDEAGAPYSAKLLPLPGFLAGYGGGGPWEVAQGLRLTAFFLERHILEPADLTLPPARERLAATMRRLADEG